MEGEKTVGVGSVPPMVAPPKSPASKTPLIFLVVGLILLALGFVLPFAGISIMGFTIGINIWGMSVLGMTFYWWSIPGSAPAGVGILILAMVVLIIAILTELLAVVFCARNEPKMKMMAKLSGIFAIITVVLFWVGLFSLGGSSGDTTTAVTTSGVTLFPHAGTFTTIIAGILSFVAIRKA